MEKKTLLLVDGSSYLYRAFHALPDLRSRAGEPTGAIYGVVSMLRRLRREVPADYIACVFDAKGKTFRDEWYPAYKAHRPPMPEDLAAQIEPIHELVKALGWHLLMVDGVEADDVIGTLAASAAREEVRTVVSTGDKDLAQLVDEHVSLVNTMSNEVLDVDGVRAKFGVPPDRIVDYFSLVGDSVDNVPGVEKVGPKTAVKWLGQYGSLDAIVEHADEIGGVVGGNLRKALDWLPMARRLLTVKCDVDLPFDLGALSPRAEDLDRLGEMYERLGFNTWLQELKAGARADPAASAASPTLAAPPPERRYETILDEEALSRWLAKIDAARLVCFDTETTSLDPMAARIVGFSFAVTPHEAAYLPVAHRYPGAPDQIDPDTAIERLRPWLEDATKPKLAQNAKYDMHVCLNHGVNVRGVVHDTLLESYVIESHKPHDMDSLAMRHLGIRTIKYEEVAGKGANQIGFDQVSVERAAEYSAEDADVTLQLHAAMLPQVESGEGLVRIYRDIEMPLMPVLLAVERNGVLIDGALLEKQSHELGHKMQALEKEAHELAGQPFNVNSPKQLQEILFVKHKLPVVKKTPSGAPSTDEEVLEQLALDHPLPRRILDYRALSKLKSTYADKLPRMVNPHTGRVHTNYGQAVAVTGRLSSTEPNLQNIPVRTPEGRRIREAFVAPPGHRILSADYSQIELRIMAHLSGDAALLKAFREGEDIHRATASEIFATAGADVTSEQRRYAKVINFGLIYGMSAFGLASQLGIERGAAQQYMERYFARYPGVADYMQRTRQTARETGYVETVFGRRLYLPDIRAQNQGRRQGAERAAINAPMQGTAADLIKLAMIAVQGWLERDTMRTRLVMQVHDELVLEVPEDELPAVKSRVPELMAGVAALSVPLEAEVGIGANWDEAH
ncbi:MAG: DNA polymerase I [Betaproteobacteria bacterium]|nr:DNA polymerase I [Betaproteobacteria bacterium]